MIIGLTELALVGFGAEELLLLLIVGVFGLGGTIFWIWALVDCATKESGQGNDKIVWVVIILLTHWIGALIYLLVRRPTRVRELGR